MRYLFAFALFALALLAIGISGNHARAQILLPTGPLPDVTRTLPVIPSVDAQPLVSLAGDLAQLRLDRITAIVRDNPGRIELDRDAQPALAGVLIATGVDGDMILRAEAKGFTAIAREQVEGLDLEIVRFAVPRGQGLAHAEKRLAKLLPGAAVDADNLYFTSGSANALALLSAAPAAMAAQPKASLGLIDGGVAAHPSIAGRVEQRGFATGAPAASRHGTAVASLLVGNGPVRGAAAGKTLLAADVYGRDPAGGNASAIVRALGWLASRGVAVTTISLVGPDNALLSTAVARAQQKGMLIVAAVGNDGPAAPPAYPASYRGVLGITGVDANGRALPEAGRALHVDFAAPGDRVHAATGTSATDRMRGTSFAAPLVAGRLARHYPVPAIGRIETAVGQLIAEARDLGKKGRDKIYGHGLICGDCAGG